MPGMVEHLYYAQLIYHSLSSRSTTKLLRNGDVQLQTEYKQKLNRERFMLAEILPDMARSRDDSHFRIHLSKAQGIRVPSLDTLSSAVAFRVDWSMRMGVYAHLFLDRTFIVNFLVPRFEWEALEGQIFSKASGKVFTRRNFFSEEGLYSAYAEATKILVESGKLKMKSIRNLPKVLPEIGVEALDNIVSEPWRDRIEWYVAHSKSRTDSLFSADEYISFIENQAVTATAQILHME